jgi:mono/diheme cytochrome c family protein
MTNKWMQAVAAATVVWAVCAFSVVTSRAQAPAASGVWSGVYSEVQAKRGEATANKVCGSCHGVDLNGGEAGPALVGLEFLGNWNQQTLGDLFDRIHSTMPADAPGSLGISDTADVIARILQLNKFPAGMTDLPSDATALGKIKIEATAPAK